MNALGRYLKIRYLVNHVIRLAVIVGLLLPSVATAQTIDQNTVYLPLVSGRAEGSGLGLPIAQQVAREHGGALSYRSRPGHTVFTLLLPLREG